ncbi:MAG TPA: SRPBCC family protein [Verrucomicrobiae bacterium]|jgi:uncharacterized membrane protein|nr:SRPBCC family protein [Verrucomicrobiae bacterium]
MKTRLVEKNYSRVRAVASQPSLKSGEGSKIEKSLTINRSPEEIYSFWRQLENWPRFMQHIQSVNQTGDGISHWVMKTSHDRTFEWDARIIEDKPGQMISWQSLEGADVDNAGSVWFTPATGGRGTVMKVVMKYSPPGGKLGSVVAKLMGDSPEKQLAQDLFRMKSLLETGEIPTIEGQPRGGKQ